MERDGGMWWCYGDSVGGTMVSDGVVLWCLYSGCCGGVEGGSMVGVVLWLEMWWGWCGWSCVWGGGVVGPVCEGGVVGFVGGRWGLVLWWGCCCSSSCGEGCVMIGKWWC